MNPASDDKHEPVEGVAGQAYFGIRNLVTLAENGGGTADSIGQITLLIQDYADLPAIDAEWVKMFPDPNNRPARQIIKMGVQRRSRVQFHMIAVI